MIIFLYGQDDYRSKLKLKEIIEEYKKLYKSKASLEILDAETLDFKDFKDTIFQESIFLEKKLIIVKNVFLNKSFQEMLLKENKKFLEVKDTILFYEEGPVKKGKLFNFFEKNAKSQEFKFLEGKMLLNWIEKEFKKYGVQIDKFVLRKIADSIGSNLWLLSNEIKKISSYRGKGTVSEKDIDLFIKPKIEVGVFQVIDAIASKNKKRALSLTHKYLESGEPALMLFSMIRFQFKNILAAKDLRGGSIDKLRKEAGISFFPAKKALMLSREFSLEELKKIYWNLFQIDLDIKTGKIDQTVALDLLIAEI